MTTQARYVFFRCPGGDVAANVAFTDEGMFALEPLGPWGACPLCGVPIGEHEAFTVRAQLDQTRNHEPKEPT